MNVTPQQAQKILSGNYTFSQLGFSMLVTRMKNLYSKDPSQATVQNCAKEINTFLAKFEGIMGKDYSIISNL